MGKVIYKYPMPAGGGAIMDIPQNFKPLSVGLDLRGNICLWAEIDPEVEMIKVAFVGVGTGWPLDSVGVREDYKYVGTVNDGVAYMWHYYYKILEEVQKSE